MRRNFVFKQNYGKGKLLNAESAENAEIFREEGKLVKMVSQKRAQRLTAYKGKPSEGKNKKAKGKSKKPKT